jgi:hypothetical protein
MDRETLIGIVEKKHHFRVDPNDPVFVLATISEVMLEEARADLQKVVADAINQASAASKQAEIAARENIGASIREAGEAAAERIRQAGEAAAARIVADLRKAQRDAAVAGQRFRWKTTAVLVCCVVVLVLTVIKMWLG